MKYIITILMLLCLFSGYLGFSQDSLGQEYTIGVGDKLQIQILQP